MPLDVIPNWSTRLCFVWATERPLEYRCRESRKFDIVNNECYLNVYFSNGWYYLFMCPFKRECSNSIVTVHLENRKREAVMVYSSRTVRQDTFNTCIWKGKATDIVKHIPEFYKDDLMIFVMTIDVNDGSSGVIQQPVKKPIERKIAKEEVKPVKRKENWILTPFYWDANACLQNLSADFSNLLDIGPNYDVQLVCGDRTLWAHSFILGTRSNVFKAMLQTDMREARTGIIQIKDMDFEILKHFIRYLYTGRPPALTTEIAKRLYEIGDCYAVTALVKRCAVFLTQHLTPENACKMALLADAHTDKYFKDSVVSYILDHDIFLLDDQWLPFCDSHPRLALEVLNRSRRALK